MTPSDEFKAQLRCGKIQEALKLAINQAIELKITTWISTSDLETDDPILPTKSNSYLRSRINIVDGKIDNEVSHQLLSHPLYSELQQLHSTQVVQGSQTIYNNLDSLQKLVKLLTTLSNQTKDNLCKTSGNLLEESSENILDLEGDPQSNHENQSGTDQLSPIAIVSEIQTQAIDINPNTESNFIDNQGFHSNTLNINSKISEESEISEEDDDWGDLIEEDSTNSLPDLANSAEAEDWDDWEIEQPEPEITITPVKSLDFEEEEWIEQEDWEDPAIGSKDGSTDSK